MRVVCILLGLPIIGSLCLARAVPNDTPPAPYDGIAKRNPFQLKEPVQPKTECIAEPVRVPDLVLNGITTVLKTKVALMKVAEPGSTNKEVPLMLSEGQRANNVKVLEINEESRTVRVNNAGTVMTVGFKKDASITSPAPSAGAVAMPRQPGITIPPPQVSGQTGSNFKTLPTRFRRGDTVGQGPGTFLTNYPQGQSQGAVAPGTAPATVAPPVATPVNPPAGQPAPLSAEELQVLQQLEAAAQQQNARVQPAQPLPLPQQTPPVPSPYAPQ